MYEYNPQRNPYEGPASNESENNDLGFRFIGEPVAPPTRATTPLPDAPAYVSAPPAPPTRPGAPRAARRRSGGPRPVLVVLLLLGLMVGSLGGAATAWTLERLSPAPAATASVPPAASAQTVADNSTSAITTLYNHVVTSVVDIQTVIGGNSRFAGSGEGSGIVLDSNHVLTNYHVIQGASSIRITLQDGNQVTAQVAGTAPQDDLAVLTANLPADKVTPATLGDSDQVQVGEEVVAIGSPFGLADTVTAGIVSAVNRQWSSGNAPERPMIQTDAPINPGNSGGPLFNLQGEVIGIDTAIQSPVDGSVGVGFAIPINRAKSLIPQLSQGSTVQRAWLGISGMSLTNDIATQLNAPVSAGVLVVGVTDGSPAAQAGLIGADPTTSNTLGDIITAVDGTTTNTIDALTNYLANKHAGDAVTLSIIRDGQQQSVKVTLGTWPDTTQQQQQQVP